MRYTFRQFMEQDTAAMPSMGSSPSSPDTPDDEDTHNDSDVMNREFDISKDDAKSIAVDGEMLTSHQPLTNIPGQKFIASAPIFIQIQKMYPDGSADVLVMFSMCNKNKIKNLDGMSEYKGPVEDLPTYMTKGEIDNIKLNPFKMGGGANAGGGMPGGAMAPPGGPPGGM